MTDNHCILAEVLLYGMYCYLDQEAASMPDTEWYVGLWLIQLLSCFGKNAWTQYVNIDIALQPFAIGSSVWATLLALVSRPSSNMMLHKEHPFQMSWALVAGLWWFLDKRNCCSRSLSCFCCQNPLQQIGELQPCRQNCNLFQRMYFSIQSMYVRLFRTYMSLWCTKCLTDYSTMSRKYVWPLGDWCYPSTHLTVLQIVTHRNL